MYDKVYHSKRVIQQPDEVTTVSVRHLPPVIVGGKVQARRVQVVTVRKLTKADVLCYHGSGWNPDGGGHPASKPDVYKVETDARGNITGIISNGKVDWPSTPYFGDSLK